MDPVRTSISYIRASVQNSEAELASPAFISIIRNGTEQINERVNRNQEYTFAVTPGEYEVRSRIGIVVSGLVKVSVKEGETSEPIVFKFGP